MILGLKCLYCFDDLYTDRTCKCSSCGVLYDDEGTLNIYVEDIKTVHICTYHFNLSGALVYTELGDRSTSFLYCDYSSIKNTELTFVDKPTTKPSRYDGYDEILIKALDSHTDFQARLI